MLRDLGAGILERSGIASASAWLMNSTALRGGLVRVVNYHGTPARDGDGFRRQLDYYQRHFQMIREADLAPFLAGRLPLARPGLLLTFDDGFVSNYEVGAPLLEEYGVRGLFFVPAAYIASATAAEAEQQPLYEQIMGATGPPPPESRPMSWAQLRELVGRGHAVGSHSTTHVGLGPDADDAMLEREIAGSKLLLDAELGQTTRSFCWPFGQLAHHSPRAHAMIRRHYDYAFTMFAAPLKAGDDPHLIQRANVEASMHASRARAATGGIAELYHARARGQLLRRLQA